MSHILSSENIKKQSDTFAGLMLVVLFLTAALGSHFPVITVFGFSLYGFRLVLILSLYLQLVDRKTVGIVNEATRILLPMIVIIAIVGMLGLFFSIMTFPWLDIIEGIRELIIFIFGIASIIVTNNWAQRINQKQMWVWRSVLVTMSVLSALGIWELITESHLQSYHVLNLPDYASRAFVSTTFDNPNNFATFICMLLPIFFWRLSIEYKQVWRVYIVGLLILSVYFVFVSNSRGILFLSSLQILLAAIFTGGKRTLVVVWIATLVVWYVIIDGFYYDIPFIDGLLRYFSVSSSDTVRIDYIIAGLEILGKAGWIFGIGPGNYESLMLMSSVSFSRATNMHNLVLEILVQYGIIISAILFALYFYMVRLSIKTYSRYRKKGSIYIFWGLVFYPLMGTIPSSWLNHQSAWLILVFYYILLKDFNRCSQNNSTTGIQVA